MFLSLNMSSSTVDPLKERQAASVESLDAGFFPSSRSPAYPDRKKFACCDDISILRTVNQMKPWEASHGQTQATWQKIAKMLENDPSFIKNKKGHAIKVRFELLLKSFKAEEMESLRKSGVVEEYRTRAADV